MKIKKNDILEYLVEGKTEQKLILQIKEEHIHSGKVFNNESEYIKR